MNNVILKYLNDKGYDNVSTDYYKFIDLWENWWRNKIDFHTYHDQTNKQHKMYTFGMAKRIAEDWSSILFTERDEIMVEANTKKQTEANNKYLENQLKMLKVYRDLPTAIEKAFAMGTAGAIIRINNVKVDTSKNLIADEETKLDIIYVEAKQIVPLRVEHGEIKDVAFVSESNVGDKKEYYIETHELVYNHTEKKEQYKITNAYLDENGNQIKKENIAETYTINSDIPMFSILKPAIANPIDTNYNIVNGLGFSIYGNAIDQIKACDITYHNFVMDFYLGGKKVFYNKKIVNTVTRKLRLPDGTIKEIQIEKYPDDVMRQQWRTYGDEMTNLKDNPAITEYNPELRTEEDKDGIQMALDLLSFKCGLGTKYYEFNSSTGQVTATQYVGDRQDLIVNANKHRKNVDDFVSGICKAILLIGRILFKEPVTEECIVTITDKDGFMVNTETAKQEFRLDIAQGIRKPWEYRVKFLGETEEIAKAMIADEEIEEIETE